jgi:molybdate transport system substrate-binding protein
LPAAGCRDERAADSPARLTVFAAASLAEAFGELAARFEAGREGVTVALNLAGSQQLAHQLSQGAPADVFASADQRQMAAAVSTGRIAAGAARIFAGNRLVVIYPSANPGRLEGLPDLARPGLRLVLAAAEVPAGGYAQAFLANAAADPAFGAGFQAAVLRNVVSYEENVRAVLSKVLLAEADAGVVYASDAQAARPDALGELAIPLGLNVTAAYPIAPLTDSLRPELADAFVAFVVGPEGQQILARHGFLPRDEVPAP